MNFTEQAHVARLMTFAQHGSPKEYGGSDMMRADLEALIVSATLPHPALDRANAGERESEGARCASYECKAGQQDGMLCADDDCDIASGVRAAALPAADPERREGAEGVGGAAGVREVPRG